MRPPPGSNVESALRMSDNGVNPLADAPNVERNDGRMVRRLCQLSSNDSELPRISSIRAAPGLGAEQLCEITIDPPRRLEGAT